MTGPIQVSPGSVAPDPDFAPQILPGFGPFQHIERYSLGQGNFSHYGIMPGGQAVPLEDFSGGPSAVGSPGQAAPANDMAPPVQAAPAPQAAPTGLLGDAAAPTGPAMPQGQPWSPPMPPAMPQAGDAGQPPAQQGQPYQPMAPISGFDQPEPQPGQAMAAEADINVTTPDGRTVTFPGGTHPDKIKEVMRRLTTSTEVPLANALDRKTGAPVSVRGAVGAAQTDEDRLATLRKFYPDAQPYQDPTAGDNFVYTNP